MMKLNHRMLAAAVAALVGGGAGATATPEELKQLGTTLTAWGAEKAGNKDGSIPAYTGGLTKTPAGITPAPKLPDPYVGEKPLFSIDAKNAQQYADKLTPGQQELIRRFPGYRMDIYPTHRSFPEMPKAIQQASIKNAANPECKTTPDGVGLRGCWGGVAFPIPHNGYEVMWNHVARWRATSEYRAESVLVSPSGETLLNQSQAYSDYPYFDSDVSRYEGAGQYFQRFVNLSLGPARDAGNVTMVFYPLQSDQMDQRTWSYTPGQRRVRLAPEFAYDAPSAQMGGAMNFDEIGLFSGKMDRYDFKLVGREEKYVPSNTYALLFGTNKAKILGKQYINPDVMRFELRRVWVVQATLKPGKRHVAPKRTFYIDEDSWTVLATEVYDSSGKMTRVQHSCSLPDYTTGTWISASFFISYDLPKSQYAAVNLIGITDGGFYRKLNERRPERSLTPESLASSGLR
ncbi:DUF1329 domain-containing protein [Massilia putida]|uniref:DUF1329 domain-containing protein n=1 Tax=Massilia putida TaxID=1141883 RepID=UPI0009FB8F0C|nr:DUF1329 domain-containing protein [Massilia putida]